MPIEVAVSAAPTKIAVSVSNPSAARDQVAAGERKHHAGERDGHRRRADAEQLLEVRLEAHLEEQEHDADLGEEEDPSESGTSPRTEGPRRMPASSSPSTAGCPTRSASSPNSFAPISADGERQEEGADVERVPLARILRSGDLPPVASQPCYPARPLPRGAVAQFGRARESHSRGRRFDPGQLHQFLITEL